MTTSRRTDEARIHRRLHNCVPGGLVRLLVRAEAAL